MGSRVNQVTTWRHYSMGDISTGWAIITWLVLNKLLKFIVVHYYAGVWIMWGTLQRYYIYYWQAMYCHYYYILKWLILVCIASCDL